jgi:hypothetical protein
MESQIWSKVDDKFAYILVLRGPEITRLKVTGLMLKRKVQGIIEALQQGQAPSVVGARAIETFDARTLGKAEVSPGNGSLTLHGTGEGAPSLKFTTADNNANQILQAVLAESGRSFTPQQEEVGVVEAVLPPVFLGGIGGLFWMGLYDSATKMAAGQAVEVKGRRRGLQRMLISLAEMLGTTGTIAVGVLLLLLVVGWAAKRIIHRPERTVWLPEPA